MKILNLYACIGGNRCFWGNDHEITAVEIKSELAECYQKYFPNDNVIVADAHQFLLEHHSEYDFIWSSPPCPSHSITNSTLYSNGIVRYPDMKLYEEIILLKHRFKGKYVVENVISYYDPLIQPQVSGRHYFWANFTIPLLKNNRRLQDISGKNGPRRLQDYFPFDISIIPGNKEKVLRNCVDPNIGKAILDCVTGSYDESKVYQAGLFEIFNTK